MKIALHTINKKIKEFIDNQLFFVCFYKLECLTYRRIRKKDGTGYRFA